MPRYEIRGAKLDDETPLLEVARYLDTVNLPSDRDAIRRLLAETVDSFEGRIEPNKRKYIFVLSDLESGRIAGTSMIIAQLGRRDAPYIYLDVIADEKYSRLLDRHFHHRVLRIGYSYDGPTELGGLIVDPAYRRSKERLGLLISYARFLFIASRRELFQDELLAELLPPLEADGRSHLWEAFGRRFTDMTYAEADRLSSENKDFIKDLFPSSIVFASVLSPEAQHVIGEVGERTRGVEKILRRIGFRYADRVDPFDGGPHFFAATDEVTLVRESREASYAGELNATAGAVRGLIGVQLGSAPYFRAVAAPFSIVNDEVRLDADVTSHLSLDRGSPVWCVPLP